MSTPPRTHRRSRTLHCIHCGILLSGGDPHPYWTEKELPGKFGHCAECVDLRATEEGRPVEYCKHSNLPACACIRGIDGSLPEGD